MTAAPLRVLVAEDEALIRMDLVEMLGEDGYQVVGQCGDGESAVRLATELRPDLTILDVKMPVLDGLSAAEQIVGARLSAVVILTAFSQRDLIERAREAGVMAYLVKPFQSKDLVPAIEMAVSRFAELTALEREVADAHGRLEARKLVDRAKSVLQTQQGMTEPEAFTHIQRRSMDERRSMRAVAQEVLDAPPPVPAKEERPVPANGAVPVPANGGLPAAADGRRPDPVIGDNDAQKPSV